MCCLVEQWGSWEFCFSWCSFHWRGLCVRMSWNVCWAICKLKRIFLSNIASLCMYLKFHVYFSYPTHIHYIRYDNEFFQVLCNPGRFWLFMTWIQFILVFSFKLNTHTGPSCIIQPHWNQKRCRVGVLDRDRFCVVSSAWIVPFFPSVSYKSSRRSLSWQRDLWVSATWQNTWSDGKTSFHLIPEDTRT